MFQPVNNLRRISNHLTRFIGIIRGVRFPYYYVIEHPRSGGTWVAHMISDYLQIPFPKLSIFPLGFECVIHSHWPYNANFKRAVYVVRDGRDVAVSSFFYALRHIKLNENKGYFFARYPSLKNCDFQYSPDIFNRFLAEWFKRPAGCRQNWAEHVRQWAFGNKDVFVVKYEEFHADCATQLGQVVEWLTADAPDPELLSYTVNKFSFEKQTGRKQGEGNAMSRKRKGLVGDWKKKFSKDTGEIFDSYAGEILIRLGYEDNRNWFEQLPVSLS